MAEKTPRPTTATAREDRLKAALRKNLARRKAQSRARSAEQGKTAGNAAPDGQERKD